MDLPLEDDTASFDDYADVVCAALAETGDDVVLVGHSYGGNTIPLVATRRPVRHLVYLCAMIPEIGRSLMDQLGDGMEMLNPVYMDGLTIDERAQQSWSDLDIARAMFYGDCDDSVAQAALARLTPMSAFPALRPCSLAEMPAVKTTYIVCEDDQMLRPEWSRQNARERLVADIIELPGAHSPFLSRPSVLADVLLRIAS